MDNTKKNPEKFENKGIGKIGIIYALLFVIALTASMIIFLMLPDFIPSINPATNFFSASTFLLGSMLLISHLRCSARIFVLEKQLRLQTILLRNLYSNSMNSNSARPKSQDDESAVEDPIKEETFSQSPAIHKKLPREEETSAPVTAKSAAYGSPSSVGANNDTTRSESPQTPTPTPTPTRSPDSYRSQLKIEPVIDLKTISTHYHHVILQLKINDEVIDTQSNASDDDGTIRKTLQKLLFSSIRTINESRLFFERLCIIDIPDVLASHSPFVASSGQIFSAMRSVASRLIISVPQNFFSANPPEGAIQLLNISELGFNFAVRITEPLNFDASKMIENNCILAMVNIKQSIWNITTSDKEDPFNRTINILKESGIRIMAINVEKEPQQMLLRDKGFDFSSGSIYGPPEQLPISQ